MTTSFRALPIPRRWFDESGTLLYVRLVFERAKRLPVLTAALLIAGLGFAPICGAGMVRAEFRPAKGPYSSMHMLLEKSIFQVDVLTLTLQFDESTRQKLQHIADQNGHSKELASQIAQTVYQAPELRVTMHFLRAIDFDRFIREIKKGAKCALKANVIDRKENERVTGHASDWFSALRQRGIQNGDELVYSLGPESLHTVFRSKDGKVFVDQTDTGKMPRLSLLGGYLAPCSEFRDALIRSLK